MCSILTSSFKSLKQKRCHAHTETICLVYMNFENFVVHIDQVACQLSWIQPVPLVSWKAPTIVSLPLLREGKAGRVPMRCFFVHAFHVLPSEQQIYGASF